MAKLVVGDVDGVIDMMDMLSDLPALVSAEILDKQANAVADDQRRMAAQMLQGKSSTGKTASSIKVKKHKTDPMARAVAFDGTRVRGARKKHRTRNAAIAFINNYGAPGRKIVARPFVDTANELVKPKLAAIAEQVLERETNKLNK